MTFTYLDAASSSYFRRSSSSSVCVAFNAGRKRRAKVRSPIPGEANLLLQGWQGQHEA